jgi:hypothetical protein
MATIDMRKTHKTLYAPTSGPASLVEVPPLKYLMVDGSGDPNSSPAYRAAVEALYGLAYTIKFQLKKAGVLDYAVMPLEGLWWADDMALFSVDNRAIWKWTMLIAQPEQVDQEVFERGRAQARAKLPPEQLGRLRLETYHEGLCAQILHTGPYAAEGPTVAALHDFVARQGCRLRGKHHEIYLKDPNRSAPEKLQTVIRQPVEAEGA